jgi:hypothetical protein
MYVVIAAILARRIHQRPFEFLGAVDGLPGAP